MSAHVLLNLLNELGKSDKMRGLSSILSLFRNKILKLIKNTFFGVKTHILPSLTHCYNGSHYLTCGLLVLLHGLISLPGATSCDKELIPR